MKKLEVTVSGTLVGTLEQSRTGGHFFDPDQDWVRGGQRPVLGLYYRQNLGRFPSVARSTHVPIWFENLLPERDSELRRLLCAHLGLKEGRSFSLLGALGQNLPGAVKLIPSGEGETDAPEPDLPRQAPDGLRFSSLAGVQLKFSMAKLGSAFTLPLKETETEWIVKIPPVEMPLLPQIEYTTMCWAKAAGLPVPDCQVVPIGNVSGLDSFVRRGVEQAFAVKRYDRKPNGVRLHQEDFAQVLNLMPDHKYGDSGPGRASMGVVAKVVRDASGNTAMQDLLARLAFVVVSGNGDAHLKNWSFVYPEGQVTPQLSPCYDQVCTIACDPERFGWQSPNGPRMALAIASARLFSQVSTAVVDQLAERVGFAAIPLRKEFIGQLIQARDAWAQVADGAPAPMQMALSQHWARVPILKYVGGWQS